MACFRSLCTTRREREAIASTETPAARPTTPRHQALSQSDSTVQKAVSQRSSPKLAPSIDSGSSASTQPKSVTKYLSSLLNDTATPANLRSEFSKGFGTAEPSVLDDASQDSAGNIASGAHSPRSCVPPVGHQGSEAENNSARPVSADLAPSTGAEPVGLMTETSGPGDRVVSEVRSTSVAAASDCGTVIVHETRTSDAYNSISVVECSVGWAAANASFTTGGCSNGGNGINGDTSYSGGGGATSCDVSGCD